MKKRSWWRLALVTLVLTGLTGTAAYLLLRGPALAVLHPTRGKVSETVVSSGQVLAPAEITTSALVVTTVREVYVKEGDAVSVGQLLVQLEDAELLAALDQAEAGLSQAQAGRFELTKLSEPAARSNLTTAEASLAEAKRNLQQTKDLYESSSGTRADYEDAQTAYTVAKAQREAAQLQLRATGKGGSQALITSAGIAVAKAQVQVAKAQLAHSRIESPVDGIVLARTIEPGDSVVAGTKMLLLSRTGETRLVIEPDERNLARLALEQPAIASAEAFPDRHFDAAIQYIAPSVDPQRGTIEVRLAVPEPPDYLRPHMTVSVEVRVGEHEDTLLVPRRVVRGLSSDAPFVFVVEQGHAHARPLKIGIRGDLEVEVLEGLDESDLVVDDESTTLAEGDRVRAHASEG